MNEFELSFKSGALDELTSPTEGGEGQLVARARPRLDLLFNAYDITDARKSKPSL